MAAIAVPLGAGVAVGASGIFPFGFVRRLEPRPGFAFDPLVLSVGVLVLASALVGWVVLATLFRRSTSDDGHHRWIDAVAARCRSSAMGAGIRFAYTSGDSTTIASRLGGAVVTMVALVGTLTLAVSMQRLVAEPAQYGRNFDAW